MEKKIMNSPRHLTSYQERKIIEKLIIDKTSHLNYGSSRIVFPYQNDKVIKIALSDEGFRQNRAEVNTYLECDRDNTLANIFAYGHAIIIAERCEFLVDADEDEAWDLINNLSDDGKEEIADYLEDTLQYLNDRYGLTSDNYQLGKNHKGYIVSLDYGFDTFCEQEQVGNICDLVMTNNDRAILKLALASLHCTTNHKDLPASYINLCLKHCKIEKSTIKSIYDIAEGHYPF